MKKVKKVEVLKYTAIFEPDKEAGGYTVTIPVLPGCISEGNSFEEALKNIKEAAELYLEVLKEEREEIPVEENSVVAPIEVRV
jgi:predicted RNase H-like HicB family nuclease